MEKQGPSGDAYLEERTPDVEPPAKPRPPLPEERVAQDPGAAARVLGADSRARTEDPAARDLSDGRIERRTSEDAAPPADS